MFPWFWLWLPQVHFPLSGAVSQDIRPTNWFADNIQGGAGDADIERSAFAVASYGRQLGLITEVLLALAERQAGWSPEAAASREELQRIRAAIEAIKQVQRGPA